MRSSPIARQPRGHLVAVDEDVAAQVLSLVALGPGQVARALG
jgi:hypothetical protein